MGVYQAGADAGKGYLVADIQVGGAADHRLRLRAQVYRGQAEAVGVGVGINRRYLPDDDVIPVAAGGDDFRHLEPGQRQLLRQLGSGQGNIYIIFKPA